MHSNNITEAVHDLVAAIRFGDDSDYLPTLWSVLRKLSPEMTELLEKDESEALILAGARVGIDYR